MAQNYIAIHTKKSSKNSPLVCTFETFDCAVEAYNRCHELVNSGLFGAYMVSDIDGQCFDRVENVEIY